MISDSLASAAAPSTASGKTARDAQIGLADNFDGFLKLLTTQLTSQDPLEPLNANEFTAQLVQFTGVEQSIKTNSMLEELLGLTRGDQLARGADLVGASVEVDAGTVRVASDGISSATYRLPESAAAVDLRIRNGAGEVVWQGAGKTAQGAHDVQWNGLDARGQRLPSGLYQVEVNAVDAAGRAVPAETTITGTVDGVELGGDGQMMLSVDGVLVPSDFVVALRQAAA